MSEITLGKDPSSCELGLPLVHLKTDDPGLQRESDENGDRIAASAVSSSSSPGIKPEESTMIVSRNENTKTLLAGGEQKQQQLPKGGRKELPGEDLERRHKLCLRAKIVGLSVLIVIVWGLLTLPIVFYHLPTVVVSNVVLVQNYIY